MNEKYIYSLSGEMLTAKKWMLVIDRHVVADNILSFLSALGMLFSAYYCFGIEYNEGAPATLDFFQRYSTLSMSITMPGKKGQQWWVFYAGIRSHILRKGVPGWCTEILSEPGANLGEPEAFKLDMNGRSNMKK